MENEDLKNDDYESNMNTNLDEEMIFSLEKNFPDIENIFAPNKDVDVLSKDSLIFLDTNVLLLPLTSQFDKKDIKVLESVYKELKKQKKIYISDRVAREFMKNKDVKLSELLKSIKNKSESIKEIDILPNIFKGLSGFEEINELSKKINDYIRKYKEEHNKIYNDIILWSKTDPITSIYKKIFDVNNIVILETKNKKNIIKEWDIRQKTKTPPGYKDSKKDDTGIGDFLIWKAMIQLSIKENKDIVFITGEQKNDWYIRSDNNKFTLRPELLNEFRHLTGRSIKLINLTTFLSVKGLPKETIKEFKKAEEMQNLSLNIFTPIYKELNENISRGLVLPVMKKNEEIINNILQKINDEESRNKEVFNSIVNNIKKLNISSEDSD